MLYKARHGTADYFGTGGGTANAQTAAVSPTPVIVPGTTITWMPSVSNTGVTTLNLPGQAGTPALVWMGQDCVGGEVTLGRQARAMWDGTSGRWVLLNHGGGLARANPQVVVGGTGLTATGVNFFKFQKHGYRVDVDFQITCTTGPAIGAITTTVPASIAVSSETYGALSSHGYFTTVDAWHPLVAFVDNSGFTILNPGGNFPASTAYRISVQGWYSVL